MAKVKLHDALRARKSATRRSATLRNTLNRWADRRGSPLTACGDTFESNIRTIEREYEDMITRINRAVENVEVDL